MTTALPTNASITTVPNTYIGVRTSLGALRDCIAGLLGTDGLPETALATLGASFGAYATMSAAGVLSYANRGTMIDATGTWALGLPAISTLPAAWSIFLRNIGTGVITLTPPDGATVDGAATLAIAAGRLAIVQYTGSAWITVQSTVNVATSGRDGLMASADKTLLDTVNVDAITALKALTPAADKIPYFTGTSAAALAPLTSYTRSLIAAVDAATWRGLLGMSTTPLTPDLLAMPQVGFKQPCRYKATGNINLATGGLLTVDAFVTTAGLRILCADQTNPAENGIYTTSTGAWTRAADADATWELAGAVVIVENGNVYGATRWATDWKKGNVLGTEAMAWSRIMDTSQNPGLLAGYATRATAGGTTSLSSKLAYVQVFTGSANQNVVMPTTAYVFVGHSYLISNKSTGTLTLKAYDGSTIMMLLAGQSAIISCNSVAADTSAAWTAVMVANAGGVIESGSNTNGKFTRLADGTLECWTTLAASPLAAVTWTYPYTFNAAPVVTGNAQSTVLSGVCLDAAPGPTTVTFSARDKTDARRGDTCHLKAVGRWM
ncbi:MAG: hypothetical protein ACOH2H_15420 [Cypionkella sp.]